MLGRFGPEGQLYSVLVFLVIILLVPCSLLLTTGPRCTTSWPVWIRSTVMSVLGWFAGDSAPRAVFLALSSGPWFAASWPVWTRGTVRCLYGLLVNLHLALCFFLSSVPRCVVRVGVRIRLYGQGLCLSSWFWCSCSLPCAFVCGYAYMGKDCACLFVVLVPVGSAVRTCVRIRLLGKDCACLSVVLVLSAIERVGSGYVFIGRDCACLSVILALVCQGCSHPRCGARQMPGVDVQKTAEPRSCISSIRSRRLCLTTETGTHSATVHSSAAWLVSPGQVRCSFWGPAQRCRAEGAVSTGTRPQ